MTVTVKIPTQLRSLTGGEAAVEVEATGGVGDVLDALYEQYPALQDRIMQDGDVRRFVNIYVADEDIRFGDGLSTSVEDGSEVTILPAVAGG